MAAVRLHDVGYAPDLHDTGFIQSLAAGFFASWGEVVIFARPAPRPELVKYQESAAPISTAMSLDLDSAAANNSGAGGLIDQGTKGKRVRTVP